MFVVGGVTTINGNRSWTPLLPVSGETPVFRGLGPSGPEATTGTQRPEVSGFPWWTQHQEVSLFLVLVPRALGPTRVPRHPSSLGTGIRPLCNHFPGRNRNSKADLCLSETLQTIGIVHHRNKQRMIKCSKSAVCEKY